MSAKDIRRELHHILASPTSPALERIYLALNFSPDATDWEVATTDADRVQYADMHANLARPIFSSLHRATVALRIPGLGRSQLTETAAEDLALKLLDFLRVLFAPWCVRDIVDLACAVEGRQPAVVVVDKGKRLRCIESEAEQCKHFPHSALLLTLK